MGNSPQAPPPLQQQPTTGINLRDLATFGIAGALGGFLFWVLAELTGQQIGFHLPAYLQILAMVFVGAMAGLFGVYLLTASDLKATKTFVFAIVCGLVWRPVLQSAQGLVSSATASKQVADLASKTNQIKTTAQTGSPEEVRSQVNSTAAALKDAVTTLPAIQDKDKRQELLSQSKNAVEAIESGFPKAPTATVDALTDVGLESSKANQTQVTAYTIQSLEAVGKSANEKGQADVAHRAYESIKSIGSQSADQFVKETAADSMKAVQTTTPTN
jgi:hypothetical protein